MSLLKFAREKYAKPYRVYPYGNQMLIMLPATGLLDQNCKRNKFLNHEAVSRVESDIIYKMQQNKEIVIRTFIETLEKVLENSLDDFIDIFIQNFQ